MLKELWHKKLNY